MLELAVSAVTSAVVRFRVGLDREEFRFFGLDLPVSERFSEPRTRGMALLNTADNRRVGRNWESHGWRKDDE